MIRLLALGAYVATVPLANWAVQHVGTCVPDGPCLIPVGFGLMAPSGVLLIGAALVLRDVVQRLFGTAWGLYCILIGALLSYLVAPPPLVVASTMAFLFSELADFAVFTRLQARGLMLALVASSALASVIDSAIFLWVAFGSLDHMAGQVVGKWLMVALAAVLLPVARRVTA
jgi:uncharacterized PurR-regulated membrane protein YhhQ (DUF165 family)